ncbi:MAG: hypothetical protein WC847_00145 [Candidatus Paceibacterota bacterium]
MSHPYKLKAKPKTDIVEDNSLKIFNNLVDFSRLDFINQGGKVINFDGQLRLLDKKRLPEIVKLKNEDVAVDTKYQIKGTSRKTQSYSFDIKDLTAFALAANPVFVFLVKINERTVYYEVINKKYIKHVLGLDLKKTRGQKTKTVKFRKQFTGKTDSLLFDFTDCENIGKQIPQDSPETEDITQREINAHKKIIGSVNSEVIFDIEAFLFLTPLQEEDLTSKKVVCAKLELEEADFDFYIRYMLRKGIIIKAGGKFLIKDVKVAKYFLSELIDRKGVEFVYE